MTIKDVNLFANLYKNPKPKRKPKKYLEKYEQKQKASSLASIYFGSPGHNHTIKTKPYETSACWSRNMLNFDFLIKVWD